MYPLANVVQHTRPALAELGDKANVPAMPRQRKDSKELSNEPASKGANAGKKRSRTTEEPQEEFDDSGWGQACSGLPVDKNCDQVRRMIHRLIDNGGMKVGEFCDKIGVSNNSYNTFLKQSGATKGMGSNCYMNAWAYFKYREMNGVKLPTAQSAAKKQKTEAKSADSGSPKGASAKGASKGGPTATDVADVQLPGEEKDAVQVYETCDEIRKKINAHMKKPGISQAQFARDLSAMFHGDAKVTAAQLSAFRGKKGPTTGNTSPAFYAAYFFFEKLRIKDGKPKSQFREEMEKIWRKQGGFDIKLRHDGGVLCRASERPWEDKYGQLHIDRVR